LLELPAARCRAAFRRFRYRLSGNPIGRGHERSAVSSRPGRGVQARYRPSTEDIRDSTNLESPLSNPYCSSRCRSQHHLGPTGFARIEMPVGMRRLFERQPVRDDERRIRPAAPDELAQPAVVELHVGLTRAHPQPLLEEETDVEIDMAML